MRQKIGRGILAFGLALIIATAIRAVLDMLQSETFDIWSVIFFAGCILSSIGMGIIKKKGNKTV